MPPTAADATTATRLPAPTPATRPAAPTPSWRVRDVAVVGGQTLVVAILLIWPVEAVRLAFAPEVATGQLDGSVPGVVARTLSLLVLTAALVALARRRGFGPVPLGLVLPRRPWVRAGLLAGLAIVGTQVVLHVLLGWRPGDPVVGATGLPAEITLGWWAASLVHIVAVTPVHEELVFRGLLFLGLRDRLGPWRAGAISSLLFGVLHPGVVYAVIAAVILCRLVHRTGSLLPAVIAHVTANGVAWLLIAVLA